MKNLKSPYLFTEACYIDGAWITANSGNTIAIHNPYDGELLGHVPDCGNEEIRMAIEAAHTAWSGWKRLTAKERSNKLLALANLIDLHANDLARIMTLEQGKPLTESKNEIDYANSFIKWFAEEGRRVYGDIIPSNKKGQHIFVIKQPIGVVGAITPWNFPAAMITRKIAPALAAGCTVVVKPDSATPFSALALGVLAEQVGIPKGVLNIVTGKAEIIGEELTSNSLVRKLSFTGSTKVGALLMKQSAPTIKKLSLELGGNAPFIIFDDADLDAAVEGAIASKFRNSGQTCVCANRILVQAAISEKFTQKFLEAVKKLKVGNGLEGDVQIGPLINSKALLKVETHIKDALDKGAKLLLGGQRSSLGNLFFEPTVISDANENMLLFHEETFGPVAPLIKFETEEEAIQLANATEFGLAAYFYSQDSARIWRVAENLETGIIGINTGIISTEVAPFGGVKQSGMGREGSKYGIDEYVELKYLCLGS